MTAAIVVWIFFALVQGQGTVGISSSTLEECQSDRETAKVHEDVLALSECFQLTLHGIREPAKDHG